MSSEKKIFALSIYNAGGDISKRWFVRVKVPDFKKGCLSWKKCYGDVNKYTTVDERQAALELLAKEIDDTQSYKPINGSRKIGYVSNQHLVTSIVHQFNDQLKSRSHRLRQSSIRRYTGMIKNMESWLSKQKKPDLPIGLLTNIEAKNFLKWLITDDHQSAESHNQHLTLFRGFYTEFILQGLVKHNPFKGITALPKQNIPALYFGNEQIAHLKKVISVRDPQLWLFVNFIYYAFIRPGELRQLKIGDINFAEARIRMRPELSKNKKLQYVSIPDQLLQTLLREKIDSFPKDYFVFGNKRIPGIESIGINAMKIRHQAILKDLGFSINHKLYSWKHTGAIACARAGIALKELQMQLRHHSLDQVDKYLKSMLVWESQFIKHKYPTI